MKKAILMLLLLVAGATSSAQVVIDLSNYYTKAQTDSAIAANLHSRPPVKCEVGPDITSIFKITQTSLSFRFDGRGVEKLSAQIYDLDSTTRYAYQEYTPTTNEQVLTYGFLQPGKYRLYLKGVSCFGQDSRMFTVQATGPPPVEKPKCDHGPIAKGMSDITPTSSTLQFDGVNVTEIKYSIYKVGGDHVVTGIIKPKSPFVQVTYPASPDGAYSIVIEGESCRSDQSKRDFNIKSDTGGPIIPPPVLPKNVRTLGTNRAKVGQRTYTFNEAGTFRDGSPALQLHFNQDGTFSDNTEGLDKTSIPNKLKDRNVFYAIGYSILKNTDTDRYVDMQNLYLPDGVRTIRQFVCDASRIPDLATFEKGFNGWGNGDNSVRDYTCELSEINLSIHSDVKQGLGLEPEWLVASRALNFPQNAVKKDWAPYNRTFSTGYENKGDAQSVYQKIGAQPYLRLGGEWVQKDTWHTIMVGSNNVPDDRGLYNLGRGFMERMGSDPRSVFTSEIGENAQGQDPDIYGRTQHLYQGAFDVLNERYPGIDPLQTGLFGDYGGDGFYGYFDSDMIYKSYQDYVKSLTKPWLYYGYGINGFGTTDHEFYTRKHINVRNLNHKVYFWNRLYNLPAEYTYLNEKVKLGTGTWDGKNQSRKYSVFTTDKVESFVMNQNHVKVAVEQSRTGEIIHYPEGDVLTRANTAPPAPWDEAFVTGFWGMLVTGGVQIWDAPGSYFGSDTTKLHWWSDQYVGWRRKGESSFSPYQSGQNGAPVNSNDGVTHAMYASFIDACAAGAEVLWQYRDYITKLSYTSYESSRGSFVASTGSTGMHLNGWGPINWNQFTVRSAIDQKKGLSLIGEGSAGAIFIYYNGHLSAHEYEDVAFRYAGQQYSVGRVYGRQTVVKIIQ
jgi:hypothetical protein